MLETQTLDSLNGTSPHDFAEQGKTSGDILYQAAQALRAFDRDERASNACVAALGTLLDGTHTAEVEDAVALAAVCCQARCPNADDRAAFQGVIDRCDRRRSLAPAAVAQSLSNHMATLKDAPASFQAMLRFSSAFHLAANLMEPLPDPGDEESFLEEVIQLSPAHLAACDRLASTPDAEETIGRLIYSSRGALRSPWRLVQAIDPYGSEIFQSLRHRVPAARSRWHRYARYAVPAGVAALVIVAIGLGLAALDARRGGVRSADSGPAAIDAAFGRNSKREEDTCGGRDTSFRRRCNRACASR